MDIVDIVNELKKENKTTQKQIADAIGIAPPSVSDILKRKGRKFQAEHIPKLASFFKISEEYLLGKDVVKVKTIPLIGIASCGVPTTFYNEDINYIPVSSDIARDGVYAVTAEGDSMLTKISHGDIIICDKDMLCENGNIVHYTTIDGESGIKKYKYNPETEQVTLFPLNTDYEPIILHREDVKCARCFKIMSDL